MTAKNYPVVAIKALKDNYIWAIENREKRAVVIVDPGEAAPVIAYLEREKMNLSAILITHHHWDHTGGVTELKQLYHIPVFAPKNDPIDQADALVFEPESINLSGDWDIHFQVLDIPAHTSGHIAYYAAPALFCGDTLFASGCGRLFEGSAAQMLESLQKIAALPDNTLVYCAHEYTLNNLKFAQLVEPSNSAITVRIQEVEHLLKEKGNSLPSTIAIEKQTNPFLRYNSKEIISNVTAYAKKPLNSELEVFTYLRKWKDHF